MSDKGIEIPAGKTCRDCKRFKRCERLIGERFAPASTRCEWTPGRFVPIPENPYDRERPPAIWGYGRASTRKQEASPETQKQAIKDYVRMQGLEGDVTFFIDASVSGKISWEERPAGAQMFKHLRPGDHVIISKLDRAFRRLSDCVLILERFEKMNIKVHIVNLMGGAIDLSSPMGRFILHVLAAFAELERAFISERTRDGMRHRKKNGYQYCHYPGYGFRWSGKKVFVDGQWRRQTIRDDEERNVMRSIVCWRMQNEPLTCEEIAEHLDNLGIITKEGKPWTPIRVWQACKAELKLQLAEQPGLK